MRRILLFLLWPISWWNHLPKPRHVPLSLYTYGRCLDSPARRNRLTGTVEFVLWKAGEQGHDRDFWYPMCADHWSRFVPSDHA